MGLPPAPLPQPPPKTAGQDPKEEGEEWLFVMPRQTPEWNPGSGLLWF